MSMGEDEWNGAVRKLREDCVRLRDVDVIHELWLVGGRLTNNRKVRAPRMFAFHILVPGLDSG